MDKAIKTGAELKEHFFRNVRFGGARAKELLAEGVFVDKQVKRDILLSADQGTMILEGKVVTIQFESQGDGVYRAHIKDSDHV